MTALTTWIILGIVALIVLIIIAARLYVRSTREVALVKTGFGGRRVVMDGGAIVIPYFHEVSRVNMQTLRLEVIRKGEAALITNDRMRVDVGVAFYTSVIAGRDGIARAAQTLGNRTFDADRLRELIEGMLVDALRAVAARLTMDELHENRGAFVAEVRESLGEPLARHGLQLDAVSLTALDQTPFTALDENNVFNAVGMRRLAEVIARSKKERAEIDAEAEVAVRRAAMGAAKHKLEIELEEREAEIAQAQQIETLKAAQIAEVVKRKADSERESARARIQMEREIQEAEIAKERELELARTERSITLANKSQEENRAKAEADTVRSLMVREEEGITTTREVAEAERRKQVAVLEAQSAAEQAQIRATARKAELLAEAEGKQAVIDAENAMNERVVAMKVELARLETLPPLVSEMVKPAEKIESIRINRISGFGSGGRGGDGDKPPVNQALDSILEMAVQMPALKKLGDELGISLADGLEQAAQDVLSGGKKGEEKPGPEQEGEGEG